MPESQMDKLMREVEKIRSEVGTFSTAYYQSDDSAVVLTDLGLIYEITWDGTVSVADVGEWKNKDDTDVEEDEDDEPQGMSRIEEEHDYKFGEWRL